jgi:hypothetical protein
MLRLVGLDIRHAAGQLPGALGSAYVHFWTHFQGTKRRNIVGSAFRDGVNMTAPSPLILVVEDEYPLQAVSRKPCWRQASRLTSSRLPRKL